MEPVQIVALTFALISGVEQILGELPAQYPHSITQILIMGGKWALGKCRKKKEDDEEKGIELKEITIKVPGRENVIVKGEEK